MRERNFDAVLVDHRMPGMSGTEVYERAVAIRPELADRFVIMSGDTETPELRQFAEARGVALLAKPFDVRSVVGLVGEVVASAAVGGRLARVGVEPASGLLAEVARGDEVLEHPRRREVRLAEPLVEHPHDAEADVEADEVGELERAHRVVEPDARAGVDVLGRADPLLVAPASPRRAAASGSG